MSARLSSDQIQQIHVKLESGQKIAAIKLYKNWTGSSLIAAKQYVERLLEGPSTGSTDWVDDVEIDDQNLDQILDAIQAGNKIKAIRLYRELTGNSLMESKPFIERLMNELGIDDPKFGCSSVIVWAIAAGIGAMAATV